MRMSPDFAPTARLWITRAALVGTGALASLGIIQGTVDTDTARGATPTPAGAKAAQVPGSGIGIPGWPDCKVIIRDGTAVMEGECPEDAQPTEPAPPAKPEEAEPAPETAEPAPRPKPKPKKHKPAKPKKKHRDEPRNHPTVSYNMNNPKWGKTIDDRGCGVVSLADNVSYLTGKKITPTKIHPVVYNWFTPTGHIIGSPYMRHAAPAVAKRYKLKTYETDLEGAMRALKVGGTAIILAEAGIFTGRGHYMALQGHKTGPGGKAFTQVQDPNQTPYRRFDGSWHSAQYFLNNKVQDRAWVMKARQRR